MCKCTPGIRTPFCGKLGCEWPKARGTKSEVKADTFRKKYKPLTDDQKDQMALIKEIAEKLELAIKHSINPSNAYEMDVAMRRLREASMWAVNGVTK